MGVLVDEEQLAVVSREVNMENKEEVQTGSATEMQTENSEELEQKAKKENVVHTIPTRSSPAEPSTGVEVEMLKSESKDYLFIQDTTLTHPEDEYDPDIGSALPGKVNLVLGGRPYITRSARSPSSAAHDVFSKRIVENAVRLIRNITASEAHAHMFCLYLVFHHCHSSRRPAESNVKDVDGDLEKEKKKMSEMFEIEDQKLLYINRIGV